jgi:ATP synthase protein I|tara:strand:+ start:224 stop:550 length:327 start_codon:yes stop_codon:yes gene_type:complete
MAENDDRASLRKLDDRLRKAQGTRRAKIPEDRTRNPKTGMGIALRLGVELVTGLVVGGGIGWLLDQWLGTLPLFLLLFFVLGAAAGMVNVFRSAREIGLAEDESEEKK